MKATEAKLLEFLKKSPQFVIPIYQRTYSWKEKECQQLWDDIIRSGNNDDINAHFMGSVVYVEKGLYSVSSQTPLLVIDGQHSMPCHYIGNFTLSPDGLSWWLSAINSRQIGRLARF